MLLFPFKNPIIPDTLYFGGISISICTWSGHTSASIIVIPFHLHNSLNIFPISNLLLSKNTFLLYFGANTTWYLQFQLVCDKIFTSFILNVLLSIYFFAIVSRKIIIY